MHGHESEKDRPGSTTVDGSNLKVTAPPDETFGSPTWYMLFVNDDGVPSEAHWLELKRATTVASDSTATWSGYAYLTEDVTVESGGKLTIEPGTNVFALDTAESAGGDADGDVELVVEGTLIADGTASERITFDAFDGTVSSGDWYGIRFDVAGSTMRTSYGYVGLHEEPSSLSFADVERATVPWRLTTSERPTCRTSTSLPRPNGAQLHIDGTDVILAQGYFTDPANQGTFVLDPVRWELEAPLTVTVGKNWQEGHDYPSGSTTVGVADTVDIIVEGALIVDSSFDAVTHIRPTPLVAADSLNGAAWEASTSGATCDRRSIAWTSVTPRIRSVRSTQTPSKSWTLMSTTSGRTASGWRGAGPRVWLRRVRDLSRPFSQCNSWPLGCECYRCRAVDHRGLLHL